MPITQNVIIEDAELPATLPCMVGAPMPSGSSAGFTPSPVFSPLDIPGCVLWLRADLGITIATGVSAWADQSGNGNTPIQPTGGLQPSLVQHNGLFNGQATLSFTAASSNSISVTSSNIYTQPLTHIVVCNWVPTGVAQFIIGTNTLNRCDIFIENPSNQLQIYAGVQMGATIPSGAPCVIAATYNSTSSAIYLNNSRVAITTGNGGTNSWQPVCIGSLNHNGSTFLGGNIAEVISYTNMLTTSQLNAIFIYLGQRYGIAAS